MNINGKIIETEIKFAWRAIHVQCTGYIIDYERRGGGGEGES